MSFRVPFGFLGSPTLPPWHCGKSTPQKKKHRTLLNQNNGWRLNLVVFPVCFGEYFSLKPIRRSFKPRIAETQQEKYSMYTLYVGHLAMICLWFLTSRCSFELEKSNGDAPTHRIPEDWGLEPQNRWCVNIVPFPMGLFQVPCLVFGGVSLNTDWIRTWVTCCVSLLKKLCTFPSKGLLSATVPVLLILHHIMNDVSCGVPGTHEWW